MNGDGKSPNVASSTFTWSGGGLRAAACKRSITPRAGENHTVPVYMAGFDNGRAACTPGESAPPEANCAFGPASRRALGARRGPDSGERRSRS